MYLKELLRELERNLQRKIKQWKQREYKMLKCAGIMIWYKLQVYIWSGETDMLVLMSGLKWKIFKFEKIEVGGENKCVQTMNLV